MSDSAPSIRAQASSVAWNYFACFAALLTLAGQIELLRRYGTPLPYQDQWRSTAVDILEPWLDGRLKFDDFFQFQNDHINAVSRLTSFALLRLNGQWNNLLEALVSLLVYGAAAFVLVRSAAPAFGRAAALLLAAFAGATLALPYAWENTLFGIQINVTAEILGALVYFRALTCFTARHPLWWLGQLGAGAALLTQRSGVLVFFPAIVSFIWQLWRGHNDRRSLWLGLLVAGLGLAIFAWVTPAMQETAAMKTGSPAIWLDAFFRQLGWPLPHPGWSLVFATPCAVLVFLRARQDQLGTLEMFLAMVALWTAAHAAAIGYARGDVTTGFVSRYTNYLAVGLVANAAALMLLVRDFSGPRIRGMAWAGCSLWLALAGIGLWNESSAGHAGYNLARRPAQNSLNLAAVRAYVAGQNAELLNREEVRASLYPHEPTVRRLLDRPGFRALLPPESGAPEARADHGRLMRWGNFLIDWGLPVGLVGALLFGIMAVRRAPVRAPIAHQAAKRTSLHPHLLLLLPLPAWLALTAWEGPLLLEASARWSLIIRTAAKDVQQDRLEFESIVGRSTEVDELVGRTSSEPASVRGSFYGTLLKEGFAYTGVVRSQTIAIRRRYLAVMVTGWPNMAGNAVRWQLEDPSGENLVVLPALGLPSGPGDRMRLWSEDVERYRGWKACLLIYDGTTDERGWVGVSQPVQSDDRDFAQRLFQLIDSERASTTHKMLVWMAPLLSLFCWMPALLRFSPWPRNRGKV